MEDTIKFARKCSACQEGMNEGYIVEDDLEYYCSAECMNEDYSDELYDKLYVENKIYYTEWDVKLDAEYELINGILTEIE